MIFDTIYNASDEKNNKRIKYFKDHPNFLRYLTKIFTYQYIFAISETELDDLYTKYLDHCAYYIRYLYNSHDIGIFRMHMG